ncbi:MAG: hypothetical protein FWD78_17255 [Treponema sp.]|nr:hypothetical protein [Treponema sp.]
MKKASNIRPLDIRRPDPPPAPPKVGCRRKYIPIPTWVDIKEKMPPENGRFLVSDGDYIAVGFGNWLYRDPNGKIRMPANNGDGMDVNYWMPIPELPQSKVRKDSKNVKHC